jgi:hypothetical protein
MSDNFKTTVLAVLAFIWFAGWFLIFQLFLILLYGIMSGSSVYEKSLGFLLLINYLLLCIPLQRGFMAVSQKENFWNRTAKGHLIVLLTSLLYAVIPLLLFS